MAGSRATILVVDDDDKARQVAVDALATRNFEVLEAASAGDALRIHASRGRVDLLFTAVVMPGDLDGFALAHRLKRAQPDLKVLYATAYPNIARAAFGGIYGQVVPKPYRHQQLAQEIEVALADGPRGDPAYWRAKAAAFRAAARLQPHGQAQILNVRASEFEAMAAKMEEAAIG
jgi:CheY-like chemotaxis protein